MKKYIFGYREIYPHTPRGATGNKLFKDVEGLFEAEDFNAAVEIVFKFLSEAPLDVTYCFKRNYGQIDRSLIPPRIKEFHLSPFAPMGKLFEHV